MTATLPATAYDAEPDPGQLPRHHRHLLGDDLAGSTSTNSVNLTVLTPGGPTTTCSKASGYATRRPTFSFCEVSQHGAHLGTGDLLIGGDLTWNKSQTVTTFTGSATSPGQGACTKTGSVEEDFHRHGHGGHLDVRQRRRHRQLPGLRQHQGRGETGARHQGDLLTEARGPMLEQVGPPPSVPAGGRSQHRPRMSAMARHRSGGPVQWSSSPNSRRDAMKIVVDYDECASNAVCMGIAPEVFEVRDDGFLYVLNENPGEELRGKVRQAANGCPTGAITIVEDE